MKKYHYEIDINLETLEDDNRVQKVYGGSYSISYRLDTNNKLDKNELLTIGTPDNGLIDIEITEIKRYGFYPSVNENDDESELIEKDMTYPYYQTDRPVNTTDEVWYECKANALTRGRK